MTTFGQLVKSHSWLSIKLKLETLFPDQNDLLDDYENVFCKLQTIPIQESNVTIDVQWVHDDYDNSEYVDVSGYYTNPNERTDEYSNSLAIEFTPWQEWMGMPVNPESLKLFSELEIIAYCLNEMTFAGFDQEEIHGEMNKIRQIAKEYDEMTPEEKKLNTTRLDDVIKKHQKNR
ncbi:DUF6557 family protein [Alkalitalea saponilacus]|uniref:Uncharacterized protein n=1 Tax=Alkalitalea saponilacus TaxID=889453 RepID=A0A1T5D5E1_9BACT|nr:DUF6557 family protein [Alkalitalea saponilacus]ASB50582.1 hypothetical protein CDL62_16235 [Alkalitalea saponilacus]SKB66837.1 hypothetical protein SAMN03080601_00982 [Alkalitalea saponilacus]